MMCLCLPLSEAPRSFCAQDLTSKLGQTPSGENMDTLFLTSIRPQNESDLVGQPLAGAVFALRPGVQGLVETEFGSGK